MKTLNLTLRAILLALALIGTATSACAFVVDGIYYSANGDKATVTYMQYIIVNNQNVYNRDRKYTGHVTIPATVTYNGVTYTVTAIGEHAFQSCNTLESVTIPNTVTTIDSNAFYYCTGLISVSFSQSVSVIKSNAFYNCTSLRFITCQSIIPPTVDWSNSFFNVKLFQITLYVPLDALEEYSVISEWKRFSNIIGFGQNTLSMADFTTLYGDTIVIPVTMENVDDITAFQTDLYLPAGFELLKDGDDYMVSLSSRKGRDHVIMTNDASDGAVRILSYSPTLKKFSGNDGDLFYLTIRVPNDGDGIVTYPVWLRKTLLTTTDEEEIGALEAFGNVNVYFYILGDVDHSDNITVADIVQTARYILNYNPEPFVFEAADMNGDGKITITDVVKIANLILDQNYEEPTNMRMMAPNVEGDCMNGEAIGNTISINLDNEQDYTAFQMDLTLPEGVTASGFELTNRASDLGLIVKDRGHGKIRVLAYNPNLKTIKDNDGAVLTFNVDGMRGDIMVDGIQMVTPNGESVHLDGFNIAANHFTELNVVTAGKTVTNVKYFNLAGQQIVEPADGVTLVVTTYNDCSRTTNKIIR